MHIILLLKFQNDSKALEYSIDDSEIVYLALHIYHFEKSNKFIA